MFFTKVIHKLLAKKRVLKFNNGGDKNALLSYVLVPPAPFDFTFFFNVSHNRFLKSYLMVKKLKEFGYNVYLYDYLDTEVDYNINYDLFIGHNKTFNLIAKKLNDNAKKILLTTGSSPIYDNEKLEERQKELQLRLVTDKIFFTAIAEIQYVKKNIEVADAFFMIGNKKISNTWGIPNSKKIFHYSNVNKLKFLRKTTRTNNFIYLSSVGQLRRGLDLVLPSFFNRKEHLYVCGDYEEPLFYQFYDQIKNSPNIHLMGYIDQTSKRFKEMVANSDFAILPSCSEGQSGSVLTLMSFGLIPVITEEVGFENIEKYGVKIKGYNLEDTTSAVGLCTEMSDETLAEKRTALLSQAEFFTEEKFLDNFSDFLSKV